MVGDILRREREKQNLTIADVEKETSIRKLYIEALERENYDELPGDVYAKGFIRNYSKFLNIDGDSLLAQFASERNMPLPEQVQEESKDEPVAPQRSNITYHRVNSSVNTSSTSHENLFASGDDFRERVEHSRSKQKYYIIIGIILVFLGAVYYIFSDENTAPGAKPKPDVTTTQTKETSKPETKNEQQVFNEVKTTFKFNDRSWIQIDVDNQTVYEGMAEKGQTLEFTGKNQIVVVAGNAGAVELTWNGKNEGLLGKVGDVVERHMTKDSSNATNAPAKQDNNAAASQNSAKQSTGNSRQSNTDYNNGYSSNDSYSESYSESPTPAPKAADTGAAVSTDNGGAQATQPGDKSKKY